MLYVAIWYVSIRPVVMRVKEFEQMASKHRLLPNERSPNLPPTNDMGQINQRPCKTCYFWITFGWISLGKSAYQAVSAFTYFICTKTLSKQTKRNKLPCYEFVMFIISVADLVRTRLLICGIGKKNCKKAVELYPYELLIKQGSMPAELNPVSPCLILLAILQVSRPISNKMYIAFQFNTNFII